MGTILLIVIYIAFIGLGVPDSLFGTAWPAIYQEFGLPVSDANFITLLISGGTVLSSLMSARVIHKYGTANVTAVSTAMTAAALLGFSISHQLLWLCLFAIPLGLGAGAIDAALNNYVALHYKAIHMNLIACFYGVGITVSPYLMSFALRGQDGWRGGYRVVFFMQCAIAAITILSLPIWKKVHGGETEAEEAAPRPIPISTLARRRDVRLSWLIFVGSCAIEFTCNYWGSTYLTSVKGMAVDKAAQMITFYYVGVTLGRFLSGLLSTRVSSWRLVYIGQGILLAAILLIVLPLPAGAAVAGLFLIGLGNGPIFPNLVYLTPQSFGQEISQSVMGTQMAAANTGILLMPPIFGFLAQAFGADIFPYYLLAMFALLVLPTCCLVHTLKQRGRYQS